MRIIVATCTVTSVIRSGCSVETLFDNSEKEKCSNSLPYNTIRDVLYR